LLLLRRLLLITKLKAENPYPLGFRFRERILLEEIKVIPKPLQIFGMARRRDPRLLEIDEIP
jgi:hypothetical protein